MALDAQPAMLRYQGIPINPSLGAADFKRQPNSDWAGPLTTLRVSSLSVNHPAESG